MPDLTFEEKFKKLPPFVQEWMAEESTNINGEIAKKYNLNLENTGKMVWVISRTIIGDIKIEEFLGKLKEKLPNLSEDTLRQMALDIAIRRFYPIRDFLGGVEALIRDLGGEIPQSIKLYSEEYKKKAKNLNSESSNIIPEVGGEKKITDNSQIIHVGIKDVLEKYPSTKNQFITSKPIKLKDKKETVNATLSNWLKDYRERKGLPPHSGMERTDYLFNSENTRNLDNSERTILGEALKAYDEGGTLPIDKNSNKIVLSELFRNSTAPPFQSPTISTRTKSQERTPLPQGNIIDLRKEN